MIGKYHPHGDQSSIRHDREHGAGFLAALHAVDGQGQSLVQVDGDNAAAMLHRDPHGADRSELLADIEKGNRRFRPQLRRSEKEPLVLPTRLPNLLINGSGASRSAWRPTSRRTISEVVVVRLALLADPDIDIEDLIRIVKGARIFPPPR